MKNFKLAFGTTMVAASLGIGSLLFIQPTSNPDDGGADPVPLRAAPDMIAPHTPTSLSRPDANPIPVSSLATPPPKLPLAPIPPSSLAHP